MSHVLLCNFLDLQKEHGSFSLVSPVFQSLTSKCIRSLTHLVERIAEDTVQRVKNQRIITYLGTKLLNLYHQPVTGTPHSSRGKVAPGSAG